MFGPTGIVLLIYDCVVYTIVLTLCNDRILYVSPTGIIAMIYDCMALSNYLVCFFYLLGASG